MNQQETLDWSQVFEILFSVGSVDGLAVHDHKGRRMESKSLDVSLEEFRHVKRLFKLRKLEMIKGTDLRLQGRDYVVVASTKTTIYCASSAALSVRVAPSPLTTLFARLFGESDRGKTMLKAPYIASVERTKGTFVFGTNSNLSATSDLERQEQMTATYDLINHLANDIRSARL
eukprot:gene9742-11377_t